MSKTTTNLNLYEVDPTTDGALTFNVQTMLNDNWDKIDTAVAGKETPTGAQAKADSAQTASEAYTDSKFPVPSSGLAAGAVTTQAMANPPMFSLPNLLHPSAQQFTRGSNAARKNLAPVPYNVLRYEQGKFGLGAYIEEVTTNLVYNSDFETITGTAQLFADALTSYTGSSAAPWTQQVGGFTFGESGATSGASSSQMTAGNNNWKPLTGSGGQNLYLASQATVTAPATLSANNNGALYFRIDGNNYYMAYINNTNFWLAKVVNGTATTLQTVTQAISNSHTYTITLSIDPSGHLTAKLYDGAGTSGTLLQTLTAADTSLAGGFLVGVGGDTGVVISNASVTGPFADGWTIGGDSRVAWALTATNPISGNYSVSAVGAQEAVQSSVNRIITGISAGVPYSLSGSIQTSGVGASGAYLEGDFQQSSGAFISSLLTSDVQGTSLVTRYSQSETSPALTAQIELYLVMKSVGAVLFDAIQLEQKAYPTTNVRNDSTTATASRNADQLSYNLSQPLPSRWFGALVWTPEQASSIANTSGYKRLFNVKDKIAGNNRYIVSFLTIADSDGSAGSFRFSKVTSAGVTSRLNSSAISFNAGDLIFIAMLDDPTNTGMTIWVGVNGGALQKFNLANRDIITDAQATYIGCDAATGFECNGTIDFPIITSQIPTDEQVNALYYSAEWGGIRDYPGALPDKIVIGQNEVSLENVLSGKGSQIRSDKGFSIISSLSGTCICTNCFWDGSAWYAINPNARATMISPISSTGEVRVYTKAVPGTSPITWDSNYDLIQALSGGYKVQSGYVGTSSGSGIVNTSVTFPVAFSTAPIVLLTPTTGSTSALPAVSTNADQPYGVYNPTTAGFNIVSNQTASIGFEWLAIGS
ncbi:hypothetical protein DEAC_c40010 [Desulfosporosinus acididurans]|uniref:Tail fiber protein n=1 Tax=Desulfosporosinus acididurans TaxID=476652 RepID=A0A0J1FKV0_9FIRM|nr:hypothetical protein [Desulfosporosinus acididurans]KLU64007.1 hypothetical protein DEAC_c40010 [Desulfosporosinus acididurans]